MSGTGNDISANNTVATATAAVAPEEGTDAFYAQCHTQFGLPPFSDITVLMFGYGSILWKQNFEFTSEYEVYIKGYKRVFFQGSSDHRGTDEKPGRVVTLLPTSYFAPYTAADDDAAALAQRSSLAREAGLEGSKYEGRVYGKAYQLPSDPKKMYDIFKALDTRETGYACVRVQLFDAHAEKSSADEEEVPLDITTHPGNTDPATMADAAKGKQVICLCYMATTENEHFLGDAPLSTMAEQMVDAVGLSGSNVEYLFFLAEKLREMGAHDPHVYALADEARRILAARAAVQE